MKKLTKKEYQALIMQLEEGGYFILSIINSIDIVSAIEDYADQNNLDINPYRFEEKVLALVTDNFESNVIHVDEAIEEAIEKIDFSECSKESTYNYDYEEE